MNAQTNKQAEKIASNIGKAWRVFLVILFGLISAGVLFLLITGFITARDWVGDRNFLWRSPIEIKVQTPLQIVKRREVVLDEVKSNLGASTLQKKVSAQEVSGSNVNGVITAGESLDEKLERVFSVIHLHESGRGTNKSGLNGYCINNGLGINEVGYAPADNFCFKDQVEQKATVMLWFKNRLGKDCVKKGACFNTVEEGLQIYNSGSYQL